MAYFTTREVKKYAGFESVQMVDYLHRTGIVRASGNGRPGRGRARRYTLGDVVLLRAVNRLLSSGLPVSRLQKGLEKIRRDKKYRHMRHDTVVERYLFTNGKDVFLHNDGSGFINLNKDGQMEFAFVVDYAQAKDEVVAAATADGKF